METTTALTSNPKPMERSQLFWIVRDTWVLIVRSLRHIFKNLDQLLALLIQPIMFMLLFRYVFGGAIDTGSTTYVNYLVAGSLIQMAAFGAMTRELRAVADECCHGRILSVIEGGYDPKALSASLDAIIEAHGAPASASPVVWPASGVHSDRGLRAVQTVRNVLRPYWTI